MSSASDPATVASALFTNKSETQKLYVKLLPFSLYDNPSRQYSRKIKLKRVTPQHQSNFIHPNVNTEFIIVSTYSLASGASASASASAVSTSTSANRVEPIKTRKKMKLMTTSSTETDTSDLPKDVKSESLFTNGSVSGSLLANNTSPEDEHQTNVIILKTSDHEKMKNAKYSLSELRSLCCHYGIKKSGTKPELSLRIYTYLKQSYYIVKLQRLYREFIGRKYRRICGPGYLHAKECVNDTDFYTFDKLANIKPTELFTYRDNDDKIYGFHIASLFHLIITAYPNITNPYNRKIIPATILNNLYEKLIYGSLLGFRVSLKLDDDNDDDDVANIGHNGDKHETGGGGGGGGGVAGAGGGLGSVLSREKQEELFIVDLFQHINTLGNYADSEWFIALQRPELIRFIRNIYDIWYYRANLSQEMKERICPPSGNPFVINNVLVNLNVITLLTDQEIRTICVSIIDRIVRRGISREDQCLGAFYILATLTIVSQDARNALPWLYEAVM
jgi:hypothetical protein